MNSTRLSVTEVLDVLDQLGRTCGWHERRTGLERVGLYDWTEWAWQTAGCRGFLSFRRLIEDVFGFVTEGDDWARMAETGVSMRELALFIAERAPHRAISPMCILGNRCEKAGVFSMLEDVTHEIVGYPIRIAPGTRLCAALNKAQRDRLARRLLLHFPYVHEAVGLWRKRRLAAFIRGSLVLAGIGTLGSSVAGRLSTAEGTLDLAASISYYAGAAAGFVLLFVIGVAPLLLILRRLFGRNRGPFSASMRTYRDLVETLVRQKVRAFS